MAFIEKIPNTSHYTTPTFNLTWWGYCSELQLFPRSVLTASRVIGFLTGFCKFNTWQSEDCPPQRQNGVGLIRLDDNL
jgi:hypothetical protein